MERCDIEKWKVYNPNFEHKFFPTYLCPVAGQNYELSGTRSSETYKYLRMDVYLCDGVAEQLPSQNIQCLDPLSIHATLTAHINKF